MSHFLRIRFRTLLILVSFLFAVSIGVVLPGASFAKSVTRLRAGSTAAKSWKVVTSPNQAQNNDSLSSVAAVSTSDVWAVGTYFDSNSNPNTLIEQWNGTSWSIVTSPNLGSVSDVLMGVARVPGSVTMWAVGYYAPSNIGQTSTLTEFYS